MGSTCSTCGGGAAVHEAHQGRRGDHNRPSPSPPSSGYPNHHLAGSQTNTNTVVGSPDTSGSATTPSHRTQAVVAANYHSSAVGMMESSATMSRHNSTASLAGEGGLGSRRESYIIGMLPGAVSRQSSGSRNSSGSIFEEGNSPPQPPQVPGIHRRVVRRHKPQYRQHGGPLDSSSRSAVIEDDAPQPASPLAFNSPVLPSSDAALLPVVDRKPSITQQTRSRQQSLLCAEDSVSPTRAAASSSNHQGGAGAAVGGTTSPMMTFVTTSSSLTPSRPQQQQHPTTSSSTISILSTSTSKSPPHYTTTTTTTTATTNHTNYDNNITTQTGGHKMTTPSVENDIVVVATSPTPESSPFVGPHFVGATSSGTTPSSNNEDAATSSSLNISPAIAKLFHDHITTPPKTTTMAAAVSSHIVEPLGIATFPSSPSDMSLDDDDGDDEEDYTNSPTKPSLGVVVGPTTSVEAAGVYHAQSTANETEQKQSPIYVLGRSADNDDGDAESGTSSPTNNINNNPYAHGLALQPTKALHTKKMRRKISSSKTNNNNSKLHPQPVVVFQSVIDTVRVRSPLVPSSPKRGANHHFPHHQQQHPTTDSSPPSSPLITSHQQQQQHQHEFHNDNDNLDEDEDNNVQVNLRDAATLSSGNLSLERSPLKGVSGSHHRLPRLTALHAREKSFTHRHDSNRAATTPKNAPPAEYKSIFAEASLPGNHNPFNISNHTQTSTSTNPEDSNATVAPHDTIITSVVHQQPATSGNPHSFSPRMRALARKQSQTSTSMSADIPSSPFVPHIIGSTVFGESPLEPPQNNNAHSRPTSRVAKDLATFTSVLNMSTCEENIPNSTDASRVWAENVRKAKEIKLQQSGYDTEASDDEVEVGGEAGEDSFGQVGTPFNRGRRRKSVSFNDMEASQNSEARTSSPNNEAHQQQQHIRGLTNVTSSSILLDSIDTIDPLLRTNSKATMSAQALVIGRRAGGITMIDSSAIETVNSSPTESRRGSVALSRPQSREESTAASFSRVVSGEANMSTRSNFWMSRSSIDAGGSRSGRQSKKVSIDNTANNIHQYEYDQQNHPLGVVTSASTIGGNSQQQHGSGGMLTADYKRFSTLSIDSSSLGVSHSPSNTMTSSSRAGGGGGINGSDRHHSGGFSEISFGHLSSMNPSSRSTFGNNSITNLAVQRHNSVQSVSSSIQNQPHHQQHQHSSARSSIDQNAPLRGLEDVTNAMSETGEGSMSPPSSAVVVAANNNSSQPNLSTSPNHTNTTNANTSNSHQYNHSGFGNSSSSHGGSPHRGRGGRGMSPVSHRSRSESSGGSSTSGSRSNSSGSARGGGGFLPCRIGSLRSSVLPVPTGAGSSSSGGGNDYPTLLSPTGRGKAPMAPRRGSKPFASSYPMRGAHPISSGGTSDGGGSTPTPPQSTSSLGDMRITTPLNNTTTVDTTSSGNSPPNPLMVPSMRHTGSPRTLQQQVAATTPTAEEERTPRTTPRRTFGGGVTPPTNEDNDDAVSVSSANTDPGGDAEIAALAIGLATTAPSPNRVDLIAVAAGRGNQSDEYFPEVLDTIRASWSHRGSSGRNSISSTTTRPSMISTSSSSRRRSTLRLPIAGGDLSIPSSPALTNEAYSASSFGRAIDQQDMIVGRTNSPTATSRMTMMASSNNSTAPPLAHPEITGLPSLPRRRSISVEATGSELGVNSAFSRSRSSGGCEETASSTSTAAFATHLSVNPNPFFRHTPHTTVENNHISGMVPTVSMATIPSYDGRSTSQGSYNNSSATSRTVSQHITTINNTAQQPTILTNNSNNQRQHSSSSTTSTDITNNTTTANDDASPQ